MNITTLRVTGLMLSFGLEVFSSQIVFIYIPLMLLFTGSGELISSITRAIAYIGPVLFGFYIGSMIDKTNKRLSGFLVVLLIALLTILFSLLGFFENIYLTVIYLFLPQQGLIFLTICG